MKAHALHSVAPVDNIVYTNFILPQNKFVGFNDLILNYQKFFRRGFFIAVLIHLAFIFTYLGVMKYMEAREIENSKQIQQRVITLTDLEPPPSVEDEESAPPPKELESISTPPKDLSALTPDPVAKEKAELETIKTQKELEEIKSPVAGVGDENSKLEYTGPVRIEEKKVEEKLIKEVKVEPEKTVFQSFEVEKAPECINLGQVKGSMEYPSVAREAGIEGRVTIKVLVGSDGTVIKVGSVSGPEVFHDEVREKSMNLQFTPGLQIGRPVKVWVTVPINFKLTN